MLGVVRHRGRSGSERIAGPRELRRSSVLGIVKRAYASIGGGRATYCGHLVLLWMGYSGRSGELTLDAGRS